MIFRTNEFAEFSCMLLHMSIHTFSCLSGTFLLIQIPWIWQMRFKSEINFTIYFIPDLQIFSTLYRFTGAPFILAHWSVTIRNEVSASIFRTDKLVTHSWFPVCLVNLQIFADGKWIFRLHLIRNKLANCFLSRIMYFRYLRKRKIEIIKYMALYNKFNEMCNFFLFNTVWCVFIAFLIARHEIVAI